MSARRKIYAYLVKNGCQTYTSANLQSIADIQDWPRVMRQLRQDTVINYDIVSNDYKIKQINQLTVTKRAGLNEKDKYRIRNRDGHRCQSCGRGAQDGVKTVVDHKIPLNSGGTHADSNLWTLCSDCNGGKQAFFSDDLSTETMKVVNQQKSGTQKLIKLFELSPNKAFPPSILRGISGLRDWPRTVRRIRSTQNMNLLWHSATEEYPDGYYVHQK
tara:strand:+ start:300 stop:947 length:648 start_codon:yes stop_codon:yes gene_type:complete